MDRFETQWARCQSTYSNKRSTLLNWIHSMITEGSHTFKISHASSELTKIVIVGGILGKLFGFGESYFETHKSGT